MSFRLEVASRVFNDLSKRYAPAAPAPARSDFAIPTIPHANPSFISNYREFQRIREAIFVPKTMTLKEGLVVDDVGPKLSTCQILSREVEQLEKTLSECQKKESAEGPTPKSSDELMQLYALSILVKSTMRNLKSLDPTWITTSVMKLIEGTYSGDIDYELIGLEVSQNEQLRTSLEASIKEALTRRSCDFKELANDINKMLLQGKSTTAMYEKINRWHLHLKAMVSMLETLDFFETNKALVTLCTDQLKAVEDKVGLAQGIDCQMNNIFRSLLELTPDMRDKAYKILNDSIAEDLKKGIEPREIFPMIKAYLLGWLQEAAQLVIVARPSQRPGRFEVVQRACRIYSECIKAISAPFDKNEIEKLLSEMQACVTQVDPSPKKTPSPAAESKSLLLQDIDGEMYKFFFSLIKSSPEIRSIGYGLLNISIKKVLENGIEPKEILRIMTKFLLGWLKHAAKLTTTGPSEMRPQRIEALQRACRIYSECVKALSGPFDKREIENLLMLMQSCVNQIAPTLSKAASPTTVAS